MLTYSQFKKMNIDLSPLGFSQDGDFVPYYCTPKKAKILATAGVDGIHYCNIPNFGEVIFAVSPMNIGDCVHPIARSFEDLLRLLLSCVDMAALEQCYVWDEEQYKAFLIDCPATKEQQEVGFFNVYIFVVVGMVFCIAIIGVLLNKKLYNTK